MVLFLMSLFVPSSLNFFGSNQYFERTPASESSKYREIIASYYPDQSKEFIERRIMAINDIHSFYRTFVPLFYRSFTKNKIEQLNSLKKYSSTIAGDTHFENFGLVIDDNGGAHFTINDFDDSTEGLLYYDVFRHYISSNFLLGQMDWREYLSAYLAGVRGIERKFSKRLQNKWDSISSLREDYLKKYVSRIEPYKFIKFKKFHRDLTISEVVSLKKALRKKYPQIEILDQYARVKEDGGSAGLLRFEVYANINSDSGPRWLDIKEMDVSSLDKVEPSRQLKDPSQRIKKVLSGLYEGGLDKSVGSIILFNKTFSLKFSDQFSSGEVTSDIDRNDMRKLALDEAYVLGKMHTNSLKEKSFSPFEYANDWEKIPIEDLLELSDGISYDIKEIYKKLIN